VSGSSFKRGTTMANNSYDHFACGDLPLDMRLNLIATISGSDEYMNSTIGHLCKDSLIYTADTCHRPNYELVSMQINSLGSKFSSQGHFHSLQLLNVPRFLFCWVVRLKTAARGNFSRP